MATFRHAPALLLLLLLPLVSLTAAQSLPRLAIDEDQISVSGVSSGGAMAIQVHVAYSASIMGVGVFAAPPYWCAEANLEIALSACLTKPTLINVQELVDATDYARSLASIDDPSNMEHDRVWIFTGRLDTVVDQGVVNKTHEYYRRYVPNDSDHYIGSFDSEHAWITDKYGNPCDFLGSPYINNCGFDAAGAMLQHIYSNALAPPAANVSGSLSIFAQSLYTPSLVYPHEISMGDSGYVYVPPSCLRNVSCSLHVAFHGCNQDLETIGDSFVRHSGLNEWADTNSMVILYPQVRKSPDVPYNPQGCWDWWGYTGLDYAVKLAPQLQTVRNMIRALVGGQWGGEGARITHG